MILVKLISVTTLVYVSTLSRMQEHLAVLETGRVNSRTNATALEIVIWVISNRTARFAVRVLAVNRLPIATGRVYPVQIHNYNPVQM
jgi:hypothetical protein